MTNSVIGWWGTVISRNTLAGGKGTGLAMLRIRGTKCRSAKSRRINYRVVILDCFWWGKRLEMANLKINRDTFLTRTVDSTVDVDADDTDSGISSNERSFSSTVEEVLLSAIGRTDLARHGCK
jgi:hypothetical protein